MLRAALDAFGRHGFASASTRDIAKSAGMPMSQITYHFGGKDGLYLACARMIADHMAALMGETLAAIEAALAASPDRQTARACLSRLLSGVAVALLDPATMPYSRFIVREQAEPTRAFDIIYSGMMGQILAALETMVSRISGQTGEPTRLMAMAMLGRNRSSPMHTPTTTTRVPSGAAVSTPSIMPGTPTHSKTTGRFGPAAPSRSATR